MNAADVAARSTWNANDISPDLKSGQSLRTALEELRKCQKLFDGWAVELDKYVYSSALGVPVLVTDWLSWIIGAPV